MYWPNFQLSIKFSLGIRSSLIFTSKLPLWGNLCKIKCLFYIQHLNKRTAWLYEKADAELVRRAINEFEWIRALSNISIDEKVYFTKTPLYIIHDFIPHERIVCDDWDPHWINNELKKLINRKNFLGKLAILASSLKTYWYILKSFLNIKKSIVYLLCFMKIIL